MTFVFDLDDTISQTDEYSEQYINAFIEKHNLPVKQVCKVARFAEKKFDWSEEEALAWYMEHGDQMALEFPLRIGAKEFINGLYEAGHRIIICTARSTDWHKEPQRITLLWLKNMGIRYTKLYTARSDKEAVCELENADFFIDDDTSITANVQNHFKAIGKGQAFLISTAYNQSLHEAEGVVRVHNYNELMQKLKEHSVVIEKV